MLEIKNEINIAEIIILLESAKRASIENKIFNSCEDISKNNIDFISFFAVKKMLKRVLKDSAIIKKHENKSG